MILLQMALGHSLPASASLFATLPSEIMQRHIAPQVFHLILQERGFLTPVECTQCDEAPALKPGLRSTSKSAGHQAHCAAHDCALMRPQARRPVQIRLPRRGRILQSHSPDYLPRRISGQG